MNINIIEDNKKLEFKDENVNLNIESSNNICLEFYTQGIVDLFLYSSTKMNNIDINIYINECSTLKLNNYINSRNSNVNINVNFLGENANIYYNSSIIGDINNKISIEHNYNNTNSTVNVRGVNNKNDIKLTLIEKADANINNCTISENSKIIN